MFTRAPQTAQQGRGPAFAGQQPPAQQRHDDPGIYAGGASSPAPAAVVGDEVVIELSRPLKTHKAEISEIRLKKPTGGDFIEFGEIEVVRGLDLDEVTRVPQAWETTLNRAALENYMVRLSGIERTILRTLQAADFGRVAAAVRKLVMEFQQAGNSQPPPG